MEYVFVVAQDLDDDVLTGRAPALFRANIRGSKCGSIFSIMKSPTFSDWANSLKNMVGTE